MFHLWVTDGYHRQHLTSPPLTPPLFRLLLSPISVGSVWTKNVQQSEETNKLGVFRISVYLFVFCCDIHFFFIRSLWIWMKELNSCYNDNFCPKSLCWDSKFNRRKKKKIKNNNNKNILFMVSHCWRMPVILKAEAAVVILQSKLMKEYQQLQLNVEVIRRRKKD